MGALILGGFLKGITGKMSGVKITLEVLAEKYGDKLTPDIIRQSLRELGYYKIDLYNCLLDEIPENHGFRRVYEDAFFTMKCLSRRIYGDRR